MGAVAQIFAALISTMRARTNRSAAPEWLECIRNLLARLPRSGDEVERLERVGNHRSVIGLRGVTAEWCSIGSISLPSRTPPRAPRPPGEKLANQGRRQRTDWLHQAASGAVPTCLSCPRPPAEDTQQVGDHGPGARRTTTNSSPLRHSKRAANGGRHVLSLSVDLRPTRLTGLRSAEKANAVAVGRRMARYPIA